MADEAQPITTEATEEEREREWHEWMGIAVGMTGVLSILAIIVSVFALASSNSGSTAAAAPVASSSPALSATTAPVIQSEAIKLRVKADDEHGRRGPDGKWHDAFLPADFTVHAGDKDDDAAASTLEPSTYCSRSTLARWPLRDRRHPEFRDHPHSTDLRAR